MVSVIIPTYNRASMLVQTLHSIAGQTYKDLEIIIVNDGSTDDTPEIIRTFNDNRIKLFNLEKQNNIARLRNIGLQNSSGEIIAFCDDDDLWEPNKLEEQFKFLKKYDFVCSNAKLIDINGKITDDNYIKLLTKSGVLNTEMLLIENIIMTPSVLLRRKILKKENPFDEVNFKNLCEDYNLWIKLSRENNLFFLNSSLISVRRHISVSSNNQIASKIINNHILLIEPFTKSRKKSLRRTAYVGLLNNRINLLGIHRSNKASLLYLKELLSLSISVFVNPFYLFALLYKIKKNLLKKEYEDDLKSYN